MGKRQFPTGWKNQGGTISHRTAGCILGAVAIARRRPAQEFGMGREVFISPEGVEYERTTSEHATAIIGGWKTAGLPPLYLRRREALSS